MPMIICEVLVIVTTSSSLIYTPSSFRLSTSMKVLSLVLPVTSNHSIQWQFFCQSSYFIFSLCCISQNCSFHPLAEHILLKTDCCLYDSFIGSFFFLSLLNVDDLFPSCPSTRLQPQLTVLILYIPSGSSWLIYQ